MTITWWILGVNLMFISVTEKMGILVFCYTPKVLIGSLIHSNLLKMDLQINGLKIQITSHPLNPVNGKNL